MGLAVDRPASRKRWELFECVGTWKLPGLQPPPPELISPASSPTSASLAHWPARNGCRSCCRACWKAGVIASTAEIGKTHLVYSALAARYCEASPRSSSEEIGGSEEIGFRGDWVGWQFDLSDPRRQPRNDRCVLGVLREVNERP